MSGKKRVDAAELDPAAENVISIQGETWELTPIMGLKGFFVVPKIVEIVSRVVYSALKADFDLRGLFGGDNEEFDFLEKIKVENLLALPYVMETLEEHKVMISNDIVPALLSKNAAWLMGHGTPAELTAAIFKAFKWHAPSIFGEKPWAALKKLVSAPEDQTEEGAETEEKTSLEESEQ